MIMNIEKLIKLLKDFINPYRSEMGSKLTPSFSYFVQSRTESYFILKGFPLKLCLTIKIAEKNI